MGISPQIEAQYEENRLRMSKVNSDFRRYMWFSIILGALIFGTAFMAGAASTLTEDQQGPGIFYYAMSAGVFQILLGLTTVILGLIASAKKRLPSLILLGINLVACLMILVGKNGTFMAFNIIFTVLGIVLNLWIQHAFNVDDELKAQAKRFLDRLEKEYGSKIPEVDSSEEKALFADVFGDGVPTFGDTKAFFGLDKTLYFRGKVGDLAIDISYALPRYAKKDGRFEIVCKGAVVVNVVQSPIVTTGRAKAIKGSSSR